MRKRIAYSLFICFLIIISATVYFSMNQPNELISEPQTDSDDTGNSATSSEESETEQQVDEETTSITDEIKSTVRNVVDSAFSMFIKNDVNMVAIGDSLTQGVGDSTNNGGYVGILENTFKDNEQQVDIINYGKRGNRSDQLLKRLDETEIVSSIEDADIVLVTIGANDIMKVVKNNLTNLQFEPFAKENIAYEKRLRDIFRTITDLNPDATVYLIGVFNPFEKYFRDIEQLGRIIDIWNESGRQISTEFEQVRFIPIDDIFRQAKENLLADDNFHPNEVGYQLIAERVLEHIKLSTQEEEETEEVD